MSPAVVMTSLVSAGAVMAWRLRETQRPLSVKTIVIPPLGMSTGLSMFLYEPMRIPWSWAGMAFVAGALFLSYPMIKTSHLRREGDVIRLKRSRAFLAILVGLVAIRIAARSYVERYINTVQTGSIFFLLAFGMIVAWRVWMFVQFRALTAAPAAHASDPSPRSAMS